MIVPSASFPGVTRSGWSPTIWCLGGLPVLAWIGALALGTGTAAASPVETARAQQAVTLTVGAADTRSRRAATLLAAVRDLRRAADLSARKPANPILRIGFSTTVVVVKAAIRQARSVGGLTGQVNAAQLVLEREIRRVHGAWARAENEAQVAAAVRQLEALTIDAARASGARTAAQVNAFKRAHLADVRYASRRWLVEGKVGRQGAVIISRGVRNARLRRAIEALYRPGAKTGDGGTADKLLAEVRAGCRAGGCEHFIKAAERRASLMKILSEEPLSVTERRIAGELIGALNKAIRVAGGK